TGSLPTGLLPDQIVAGDLDGSGLPALIVRNSFDASVSVFLPAAGAGAVGPGVHRLPGPGDFQEPLRVLLQSTTTSDLSVLPDNATGLGDIALTDRSTGMVQVIRNLGTGFDDSEPSLLRSGTGTFDVRVVPLFPWSEITTVSLNNREYPAEL